MTKELGAAIVGCRAVAPLHAKAIARCAGVRLVAVCDLDSEPAQQLAKPYGAEVIADYDQVLARDDVQLVHIVTPDELHASMAVAAARSGKHALVEKPIAMSLTEFDAVAQAAEQAGVKVMCAQSLRFRPKFRAVTDAVRSGRMGRPVFARMSSPSSPFWTPGEWAAHRYDDNRGPAWLLMHNGMHQFDYLSLLFDSFPAEVYTASHPGQDWLRVHEYVAVNVRFENGAIALSEENRIMPPGGHPFHCDLHVVGTEGTLEASDRRTFSMSSYTARGLEFPGAHVGPWDAEEAFAAEVQAIVDAIVEEREPDIPLSFTRRVLQALRTACRAFESGRNESVAAFEEGGR